ncbi:glycosyltransferase family 4 protein [Flagellimonas flava]|uniref:Glycosyl transferase 4-like domain-containing protein n=1 Tax=Flagellimonas flava TaxID=570519 RepID=A0A1M5J6N8_9FLAO|nr:glycosyltransferase family 4 protein [Allomuricauda flava]SHG36257.1 Glycosyl transferase 4-like domain-containing protein [Allomuricauda flava]
MKVVFLALGFPHKKEPGNFYMTLMDRFHSEGHEVTIIAPAHKGTVPGLQQENNFRVLRVKTLPQFGVNFVKKGLANLLLPYQYKKALRALEEDSNFDLIFMPTPPITLYNLAYWLKKKSNGKIYLILRDIFPQNAVDLGIMKKNGPFYHFFRNQERKLYKISDAIGCMSPGNMEYVKKHNPEVDTSKLHLLPNWSDMLPLEMNKQEIFNIVQREAIKDKFVIIFGGNIGRPQKMENIIELAIACEDMDDVLFLIYGYGAEYKNLKAYTKQRGAKNVQFGKELPYNEFIKVLSLCQVGLISLSEDFTIPNIPSKSLSYYNAKIPILASIDLNTDFGNILEENRTGVWAKAGDVNALKEQLLVLYNDPDLRKEMGENGYEYMKSELSTDQAFRTVLNQIKHY